MAFSNCANSMEDTRSISGISVNLTIQPLGLFLQWVEYATVFHMGKQWHNQLLLYSPRNSIYRTQHNLEVQAV